MPSLKLGDTALIIAECKKRGLLRAQCAYVLATAHHETAHTMHPVRETLAPTDAKAKERLTRAWKAGKLKQVKADYWSSGYFGRGYVQLTHKANYARAGAALNVDLVANPSKAMEPTIAAAILVRGMMEGWFSGRKLTDYVTLSQSEFNGARRVVNGTDKASLIAGYAADYDLALRIAGYDAPAKPEPAPAETPVKDMAMSLGDTGPLVEELQRNLTTLGVSIPVTGKFDKATEDAVKAFQSLNKEEDGNPLKVDGKVGHRTSKSIQRALSEPELREAKNSVPPPAKREVKERTGLWAWIVGLFGGGALGGGTIFERALGAQWLTVVAVGGTALVFVVVLLLLQNQIAAAFDKINKRASS